MIIKLSKSDDYATMEQMIANFFRTENAYKKKVKRLKERNKYLESWTQTYISKENKI